MKKPKKWVEQATIMTTTALNTVRDAWDSLLGRILIIGLSAGWVPFYFLTRVHASLTE